MESETGPSPKLNVEYYAILYWQERYEKSKKRIEKLEADLETATMKRLLDSDRIQRMEAALRKIAEGDIPRTVKAQFRDDGEPSKHDRCEHGQWMYEECGCCVEDYAREVLK